MNDDLDEQSGFGAPDLSGVVVGYDGSASADIALEWAGEAAQRYGVPLTLLRARPDAEGTIARLPLTSPPDDGAAIAPGLVEAATRMAAERPGLSVQAAVHPGSPVQAMLAASESAQMLVIGSRGLEGFRGLLLGSTAMQLAPHASCPVVVLYEPGDATAAARANARHPDEVVVGYDGSTSADVALAFGLRHAKACDLGLAVVIVRPGRRDTAPAEPIDLDSPEIDEPIQALAKQARAIADSEPDVAVSYLSATGRPTEVLIAEAAGAPLAAVGARGLGGFAGLALGSVGLQMLMHAECPVAVVHDRATDA